MNSSNSSTVQQFNSSSYGFLVVFHLLFFVGCYSSAETLSKDSEDTSLVFDAGIVFSNAETSLGIPLDSLGIVDSTQVLLANSSCDCVVAKPVDYLNFGHKKCALQLRFLPDVSRLEATSLELVFSLDRLKICFTWGNFLDMPNPCSTDGGACQIVPNGDGTSSFQSNLTNLAEWSLHVRPTSEI